MTRLAKLAFFTILLFASFASAQVKPRINFDRLLSAFPNLPWDFEIRYVEKIGPRTGMLRIHFDGSADLVRWRPEYEGSLASVCHAQLEERMFRRVLELLRDRDFNNLPSDSEGVVAIARTSNETVISVRLGRTIVRKFDRGQLQNDALTQIEDALNGIAVSLAADPKSECDMETVPAKP